MYQDSSNLYTYKFKDCTLVAQTEHEPLLLTNYSALIKKNTRHKIETLQYYAKDVPVWAKRTLASVYDGASTIPLQSKSLRQCRQNFIHVPDRFEETCFCSSFHRLYVTLYYVVTYMAGHISEVKLGDNVQIGFKGTDSTFSFPINKKNLRLVSGLVR
jgi:hypothetical protein